MSTNPFFNAEDSGPVEVPTESQATEPEQTDSQEEPSEQEETATLFTEEDSSEDFFEDTQTEDTPDTIPYKRFQKVIAERNQERDARAELSESLARVEGQLSELHGYKDVLSEKYEGFKDPLQQASWDADFLKSADALVKTDPEVAAVMAKVQQYMETGNVPVSEKPISSEPQLPSEVTELLNEARSTAITNALPDNVSPAFKSVFTDYALANIEGKPNEGEVFDMAKQFIKEKGWTEEQVYSKTNAPKSKPPTSSQTKADTSPRSQESSETAETETPKGSREERQKRFEKNQAKIISDWSNSQA